MMSANAFEPKIVALFCNWCTYIATDTAGVGRKKYPPNIRVVRMMCSGRLDPQFVLAALANGADGVLIGGCHPGDCHYSEGNYKALRQCKLIKRVLSDFGIEEGRVRLEWISASEADKLQKVVTEFVEELKELGPLEWPGKLSSLDLEIKEATE
jgi:F420-non-reducing hydrogenase iron-sulfur subunit